MPKITILPHPQICPEGATVDVPTGANVGKAILNAGYKIPHACEFNGACATCHIIVRKGFDSLEEPSDNEYDRLDQAFGACALSRLSCQVKMGKEDLTIEIPIHNRNVVGER